ncbi:hypothetical protein [Anaerococcus tetradius]|uniref:hypothetical protein n=1 Tax=Anaerococcus tetradius TaxID=33036 RepID=UPI0023F097B0|nr:hypothetical protein [Anaerococcus tetradius]
MKIKLFYDDEYIEGKDDYSCMILTIESWEDFWDLWNDSSEFIRCDNSLSDGSRIYLKKDCVIQVRGESDEEVGS